MASRSYLCLLAFHQDTPDYRHHPAAGRDLPVREAHYQDSLVLNGEKNHLPDHASPCPPLHIHLELLEEMKA